jgi:hypothetical protein
MAYRCAFDPHSCGGSANLRRTGLETGIILAWTTTGDYSTKGLCTGWQFCRQSLTRHAAGRVSSASRAAGFGSSKLRMGVVHIVVMRAMTTIMVKSVGVKAPIL